MKKLIIIQVVFIFITCYSCAVKDLEITVKNSDFPIKFSYRGTEKDSSYAYICFPKNVVYKNSLKENKLDSYHFWHSPYGQSVRYIR